MPTYEINVSFEGRHWFATHERSIKDRAEALAKFADMVKRFPACEGFRVDLYEFTPKTGREIASV